jgi:hypothetical protein
MAALLMSAGFAAAKDLFKKDLSDANCKKPVWSFSADGVLGSTEDQILWTNDDYENFEIDLEFRVTEGGNGGVILYSNNTDNWIPDSIEIQIADYDYWLKKFGTMGTCGAVFGFQGPTENASKPLNEWNKLKITAKGKNIKVYINKKLVNDFDMSKYTDAKKTPDGKDIFKWLQATPRAELPTKGKIGFQGRHGTGDTNYRNLKITPLK